jgi:hypothetical protein
MPGYPPGDALGTFLAYKAHAGVFDTSFYGCSPASSWREQQTSPCSASTRGTASECKVGFAADRPIPQRISRETGPATCHWSRPDARLFFYARQARRSSANLRIKRTSSWRSFLVQLASTSAANLSRASFKATAIARPLAVITAPRTRLSVLEA